MSLIKINYQNKLARSVNKMKNQSEINVNVNLIIKSIIFDSTRHYFYYYIFVEKIIMI